MFDLQNQKRELRFLLSTGRLEETLSALKKLIDENSSYYNDIIDALGKFRTYERQFLKELISIDEYNVSRSKIQNLALEIIEKVAIFDIDKTYKNNFIEEGMSHPNVEKSIPDIIEHINDIVSYNRPKEYIYYHEKSKNNILILFKNMLFSLEEKCLIIETVKEIRKKVNNTYWHIESFVSEQYEKNILKIEDIDSINLIDYYGKNTIIPEEEDPFFIEFVASANNFVFKFYETRVESAKNKRTSSGDRNRLKLAFSNKKRISKLLMNSIQIITRKG